MALAYIYAPRVTCFFTWYFTEWCFFLLLCIFWIELISGHWLSLKLHEWPEFNTLVSSWKIFSHFNPLIFCQHICKIHTLNGCGHWIFLWLFLAWVFWKESGTGGRGWQCASIRCYGSSSWVFWDEPRWRRHWVPVVIRHPQQQKLNLELEWTGRHLVISFYDMALDGYQMINWVIKERGER